MTIRNISVLGLVTVAILCKALPALKGSSELDRVLGGSSRPLSPNEPRGVLNLSRDEFVSLSPTTSSQSCGTVWASRWTTPAWGDVPTRAWRITSAAVSSVRRAAVTDNEIISAILITWWSLCAVYGARTWMENGS